MRVSPYTRGFPPPQQSCARVLLPNPSGEGAGAAPQPGGGREVHLLGAEFLATTEGRVLVHALEKVRPAGARATCPV